MATARAAAFQAPAAPRPPAATRQDRRRTDLPARRRDRPDGSEKRRLRSHSAIAALADSLNRQAPADVHYRFVVPGGGRIVTVTSGSSLVPDSLMSAYSASKSAFDSFVESVHWELAGQNVIMKLAVPGFVPTTRFVEQT